MLTILSLNKNNDERWSTVYARVYRTHDRIHNAPICDCQKYQSAYFVELYCWPDSCQKYAARKVRLKKPRTDKSSFVIGTENPRALKRPQNPVQLTEPGDSVENIGLLRRDASEVREPHDPKKAKCWEVERLIDTSRTSRSQVETQNFAKVCESEIKADLQACERDRWKTKRASPRDCRISL